MTAYRMGHKGNPQVLWSWYVTTRSQKSAHDYFSILPKRYDLEMELVEYHLQQERVRAAQNQSNIGKVTFNSKTGYPEPVQDSRYIPFTDLPYCPALQDEFQEQAKV